MSTPPRTTLSVRYNPAAAWLALAIGATNLVLGVLAGVLVNMVIGILFLVIGAVYLSREYFTYTPHTRTLEVIAPIGTRRSFHGSGGQSLAVEGNRIVLVKADGRRKKIPVMRWLSRGEQWDAVTAAIGQAQRPA